MADYAKKISKSATSQEVEIPKKKTPLNYYTSIQLKYVKLGYHYLISNAIYLMLFFFFIPLVVLPLTKQDLFQLRDNLLKLNHHPVGDSLLIPFVFLAMLILYLRGTRKTVYLVDFACCKPHPSRRTSKATCVDRIAHCGTYTQENVEFQRKLFEKSGVGDETYLPEAVIQVPPNTTMDEARKEAENLMFLAVDGLLAKAKVLPKEIGILIINCSVFNPLPSLCATVVKHYKLKEDVVTYNLGGMGCSAGLISIDLAKDLLKVHANSYAMVVSLECLTQNWYCGNNRSMLISNCLFRMGAAAILLSNKRIDRHRSKYQLVHVVRTNKGANDNSYSCVYQQDDHETGLRGIALSKDLLTMAGDALKTNITTLGPLVLPISEQLIFLVVLLGKKVLRMHKLKPYVPDFKLAFEHFCVHAGGRAVLDELEKNLQLSQLHMEPSRMTLYRYGNTSSSSLWYELAYLEAKGRIKRGDRTWQIGFGSGFKCNSAVWRALRNINPKDDERNPWMAEIDDYPINVPQVSPIVLPTF
ncbi:3-ketoacyl-CoA synthase 11-like [Chenopodium quinoa]|uniref:3-ketoacyl-CoA synthase n=1 Tax=Chenopodium quinoa TaxID=63459 RepID=A0A803MNN4_CHEQI|nr:3-ketoacyl-CoA synthase 11-like [Chenopodium quinoa]